MYGREGGIPSDPIPECGRSREGRVVLDTWSRVEREAVEVEGGMGGGEAHTWMVVEVGEVVAGLDTITLWRWYSRMGGCAALVGLLLSTELGPELGQQTGDYYYIHCSHYTLIPRYRLADISRY